MRKVENSTKQILSNCSVVDKDQVAADIAHTLMEMNAVYRLAGVPSKSRGRLLRAMEETFEHQRPADQAELAKKAREDYDDALRALRNTKIT